MWKTIATIREKVEQHFSISLYKNAYYLMAGALATYVLGFVFLIVITTFYTKEAVGLASAIVSILGLIAVFAELGFGTGLIRFLPSADRNGGDIINTCFTLSGIASIAIALILLAGVGFWLSFLLPVRHHPTFFITFIIFAVVYTLKPLTSNVFMAKRTTKFIVIADAIAASLKIVLVLLFTIFLNNAFGIVISAGLSMAVALLVAFWFLSKLQAGYHPFPKIQKKVVNKLSHYSVGNYGARALLQVTPLILPLMVISVLGAEANAYFYIAWSIVVILQVIPSSICNSLFAEGSNEEKSLQINSIRSLKLMFLILIPIVLVTVILSSKLLLIFGNAYSEEGTLLLCILALSVIPRGFNYFYISIERVRKNIGGIIKVTAMATLISLGLGYFLILKIGLVGMGIGYLTGQSIVSIAVAIYLWWSGYFSQDEVSGKTELNI